MAEIAGSRSDATLRADPTRPRQAVVLIHGIGEQRPMDTLRGFVAAMLRKGTYYSKPDDISGSFELRRLKLRRGIEGEHEINIEWPETDFYEYYWAHHMHGTVLSHIVAWLVRTLGHGKAALESKQRRDRRYHARLRWLVPAGVAATLLVVGIVSFAITSALLGGPKPRVAGEIGFLALVVMAGTAAWKLLRPFAVGVVIDLVGDAARYFDVNPKNVARRYDILRGGVDMLRKLSDDCDSDGTRVIYRYGRIVLIGHSLGSVIAYDILKHYFMEINGEIAIDRAQFEDVENFHGNRNGEPEFEGARAYACSDRYRRCQRDAWRSMNMATPAGHELGPSARGRRRWIVTDLVTLGSPLTYAPILMANDVKDLEAKIALRELPTCPPDRSHRLNRGRFTIRLSAEAERLDDHFILQHHALFAVTRWTNFFFENDPVAGPLAELFGNGIDDIALEGATFLHSHVSYWRHGYRPSKPCRDRLRRILMEPVYPKPSGQGADDPHSVYS